MAAHQTRNMMSACMMLMSAMGGGIMGRGMRGARGGFRGRGIGRGRGRGISGPIGSTTGKPQSAGSSVGK